VLFAGFCRALLFLGESIAAGVVFWREAARVVLAVAAGLATGTGAFCTGARTRFLGTSRAAFSLSSLDISSLPRFLPREVVCLGIGFVAVGFATVLVGAAVVAAVRVLRVAGAGAAFFLVIAAFAGAALAVVGLGARLGGASSSESGIWRFVAGTRLTRRSRRDRRLAH
jgi:hypothetical protein